MRIATVTDWDEIGGAARVAGELVARWKETSEVRRFVGSPNSRTGTSYSVSRGQGLLKRLGLHNVPPARGAYERLRGARLCRLLRDEAPDVINVHDVHHFSMPVERFMEMGDIAPVVWTLHNAWSCVREGDPIGSPGPGTDSKAVLCAKSWSDRDTFFDRLRDSRFHAATPSQWLGDLAINAGWPEDRVSVIPNGLDLDFFSPLDREFARQALSIPSDRTCLLFVAYAATTDPLKGYHLLDEALNQLQDRDDLFLLVVGGEEESRTASRWIRPLERNRVLLRLCYAAADCCVQPSLVESFGLVLAEAQAMEIPCVAFRVTACPEVVEDGETGLLAPECTSESLAGSIRRLLELDAAGRAQMGRAGRRRVQAVFDIRQQAERYCALFQELAGV